MKKQKKKLAKRAVRMRRRSLGAKDAQILALTRGASALKVALEEGKIGVAVARKAAEELRDSQAALAAELDKLIEAFAPAKLRGRAAPASGETRRYRVQIIGEGEPFIRVPTGLLEARKGASVVVHFGDKIVIQRDLSKF
jgi:hypothetical protein